MGDRNPISRMAVACLGGLAMLWLALACTPQVSGLPQSPLPSASATSAATNSARAHDVVFPAAPSTATATTKITITTTTDVVFEATPTPTVARTVPPSRTIRHITFWTIESISPQAEGEAGKIFSDGLRAFEKAYPGTSV